MTESNSPSINLSGKLLTLGEGGVKVNYNDTRLFIHSGRVTSTTSEIVIQSGTYGTGNRNEVGDLVNLSFSFSAAIQDHKDHKVGLVLRGKHPQGERGIVSLEGKDSNTFTGDTVVEGVYNSLALAKDNGTLAISGDVYVKAGAAINIVKSNQIADSSRLTLSGRRSIVAFSSKFVNLSEAIHELVIDGGEGVLNFGHNPKNRNDYFTKTLILDDLIIKDKASLRVIGWQEGRDHLLVRKDSQSLQDALRKISIDGWGNNQIYLKNYDKDYWSIEAAPEPSTYGAILGATALGIFAYRRKRERSL